MADATIGGLVLRRIKENPTDIAVRSKNANGDYVDTTWAQLGQRMETIAAGLLTSVDTVEEHAAIAVLGNTSLDWIACDFACLSIGLRTVPVYATLLSEECGYLHTDTQAIICIVENAEGLEKIRDMRKGFTFYDRQYSADEVKLRHIVVMNPEGIEAADDWESLEALEARGTAKLSETADDRAGRLAPITRDQVCTYTYTSGTTGPPKGVIQTNENMLSFIENIAKTGLFTNELKEGGLFLFLPLAHSFGRLIEFSGPFFNAPIVIAEIPTLLPDLTASRPGFFPAAPRVFEKIKARLESGVADAPPTRQKIFHWAINTGRATVPYRSKGQPLPFGLKLKLKLADKLVLSKIRAKLGMDRMLTMLSGSAPLNVEVHEFFLALNLELVEAYGLTETCPGLTANLPNNFKLGTVGPPLPGVQIKIADDGEILAKGPNITSGYLNRPDSTAEAFNSDGWFLTGDLGTMDSDGFVKITGRKKELMKTSGGKYIAPAKLEGRLKNLTIIQEVVTVADTRNYVTALIAIDPEELADWAKQTGNSADLNSDAVCAAVQAHVDQVNTTLAKYETVKYFRIVEPMTTANQLLTASLKVKRKVVYERYADLIDDMYNSNKRPAS